MIKLWVKGGLSGGVMSGMRKESSASGGGQQVYRRAHLEGEHQTSASGLTGVHDSAVRALQQTPTQPGNKGLFGSWFLKTRSVVA